MDRANGKLHVNKKEFIEDFLWGRTDEELRKKYSVTHSQMTRLVGLLKESGDLTSEHLARRGENLRIRFGEEAEQDPQRKAKASVDLDTGLVLHCPSCGAAVERGAKDCRYCGAHLDFSLKGKTVHCPHCFQRIPADSRFCMICARPAKKQEGEAEILQDRPCPRCGDPMRKLNVVDFSVAGCVECSGLFVPHETFEMMQDASDRVIESTARQPREEMEYDARIVYLRCPVCKTLMNRKNFALTSGVILDICGNHGIWFDGGELEKIMEFIAKGGLEKAREIQLRNLKEEAKLQKLRRDRLPADGNYSSAVIFPDAATDFGGPDLFDMVGHLFKILKRRR
jgi:Zn-finger nucleic acid-binding protein